MSERVKLTFNGIEIEVEQGTYLIEAAKKAGAEIPHFCYHPKLKYDANCRMCIVEIEKMPKLQTSCSTLASQGMVVRSDTARVKEAQEGVMAFILGNHPLDCPECDQGGECQLQDFAHQHSPTISRFAEEKRVFQKEYFGPLIEKEMNRCVSCLRCVRYCDEVLDVNALGSIDRGTMTEIGGFAHHELDCEFCGGCIQICPVGALTSRLSMYHYRPWQVKKTETVCNYCGDGCQLTLETIDNNVIRVSSELGIGRNEGDLCARGFFGYGHINNERRLMRPLIRKPQLSGQGFEVTWEMAIDKAVAGLSDVVARHGPKAVGGLISARLTNEEIYLFQKLMRQVIGTPHIDSSARYGHINAIRGLHDVFGTSHLAKYEDIIHADVLLAFAGEMTETNPIVGLKVKEAVRRNGATLICVDAYNSQSDAYRSHLPRLAKCHLQVKMGTEGAAILGLLKALLEGPTPPNAPLLAEKVKGAVSAISFEQIEAVTSVPATTFKEAATLYANAKKGVLLFGRAITRNKNGYENVCRLSELAILSGQVGKSGAGLLALAEENNEQGAVEMGGVTEYLPGLVPVSEKGYTLTEMMDAAEAGEIKALYLVGENPLRSLPQKGVEETLRRLDLLICQDLFPTETGSMAHILLPAASFAEKEGRFTNQEGETQKIRSAILPVGNAKPDWKIFSLIAQKMGRADCAYKTADEIWKEAVAAMPKGWPSSDQIESKIAAYSQKERKGYDLPAPVAAAGAANGSFDLQVGQLLFHSGRMSTYADGLNLLFPKEALLMNPDDAEKLGIQEGEVVLISSGDEGDADLDVPVKFSRKLSSGTLFFPEHFGLQIRRLLSFSLDPDTNVPYIDHGKVILKKVPVPVLCRL